MSRGKFIFIDRKAHFILLLYLSFFFTSLIKSQYTFMTIFSWKLCLHFKKFCTKNTLHPMLFMI